MIKHLSVKTKHAHVFCFYLETRLHHFNVMPSKKFINQVYLQHFRPRQKLRECICDNKNNYQARQSNKKSNMYLEPFVQDMKIFLWTHPFGPYSHPGTSPSWPHCQPLWWSQVGLLRAGGRGRLRWSGGSKLEKSSLRWHQIYVGRPDPRVGWGLSHRAVFTRCECWCAKFQFNVLLHPLVF